MDFIASFLFPNFSDAIKADSFLLLYINYESHHAKKFYI
jgi:hypothetical protein